MLAANDSNSLSGPRKLNDQVQSTRVPPSTGSKAVLTAKDGPETLFIAQARFGSMAVSCASFSDVRPMNRVVGCRIEPIPTGPGVLQCSSTAGADHFGVFWGSVSTAQTS